MPGARATGPPPGARTRAGAVPDLDATMLGIAAAARRALGADRASCYAYDLETQVVSAVYTTEDDPRRRAFLERAVGLGAAELPIWRLQLAQPDPLLVIEDVTRDPIVPPALAARLGSGALIGVRLEHFSVNDEGIPPKALLGTLFCSYAQPRGFSAAERQAARGIATLAALTLANSRMQDQTTRSLAIASAASEAMHRERDYSAALVASMQDGLTVLSPEGVVVEVSPSFCRMTGFSREELIGRACPYPYWAVDAVALERGFRTLRETSAHEWDLEFRRKGGELFPVILAGSLLRGQGGEVVGYLGTVKDITERQRVDRELRRSAARNEAFAAEQTALRRVATQVAAEAEPDEIFAQVAKEAAGVSEIEAAVVVRFTPGGATVVGSHGDHLQVGEEVPVMEGGVLAAVTRTGTSATVDYRVLDPGLPLHAVTVSVGFLASVAAPISVAGRLWGAVVATARVQAVLPDDAQARLERFAELVAFAIANTEARRRLAAQAASDPLTGLANHRAFFERLHADVERARRHGQPLSLVVIDLDHFKRINDTLGHPVGDRTLIAVAERLTALVRPEDTLARIGGEEFAWLLPQSDATTAWSAAERARLAVAATPFPEAGRMTMSAGIAALTPGGSVSDLFRAADAALYWAKAQGRDACVPYTAEHERAMTSRRVGVSPLIPSVERLLALAREGLGLSVGAILEFTGATQVWRHLDGDGEALGVRLHEEIPLAEAKLRRVREGRLPTLIRDLRHDDRAHDLPFVAGAGAGAYAGVPITLPEGELYGMLCCLSARAEPVLGERDVRLLRIVATMLGEELEPGERTTRTRAGASAL